MRFSNVTYCDIFMVPIVNIYGVFIKGLEGKEERSFLHVLAMCITWCIKVTVDHQRPNFMIFFLCS